MGVQGGTTQKIGMRVCPLGGSGSFDAGTWADRVVTSVLSVKMQLLEQDGSDRNQRCPGPQEAADWQRSKIESE